MDSAPVPLVDDLTMLVDHREAVPGTESIEAVYRRFQDHDREYVAVIDGTRVLGLCSRSHVRGLLGGRYGFALHHRAPISQHLLPGSLVVRENDALRDVLERALSRDGDAFYQDVLLVDSDHALAGLISTHRLVRAQSALMQDQFRLVASQRGALEQANVDLSRTLGQRQELEHRIVAKEKAALVETLAGGIAHEINNKLMPIVGYAELLNEEIAELGQPRLDTYCRTILESALESARIIRQLLQLSKPTPAERSRCDLRPLVEQGLTLVALRLREAGVALILDLPDTEVAVRADGAQIKQLLVNLVLNAVDAMESTTDRRLTIRMRATSAAVRIEVSDVGTGIDADYLQRIFDPFFTTKAPNRGTGLGLSVCLSIVRQHEGDITVESHVGRGTTFQIELPLARGEADAAAPSHSTLVASRNGESAHVLVVDDEDGVSRFVQDALTKLLGCRVERAVNGQAAIEALAANDFAMVISDVRMPGVNGVELLEWVLQHRPALVPRLLFMTGDASSSVLNAHIIEHGIPMLRKPFTIHALVTESQATLKRTA